MIKFPKVESVTIPEGSVKRIRSAGKILWEPYATRYVSLGDSIAAGHTINDRWETDYGRESQYGYKRDDGTTRTEPTVIVPGCYTDLIRNDLIAQTNGRVKSTSFARSGDINTYLRDKLNDQAVVSEIAKADIVTVCIGANTILGPALENIANFVAYGNPTLLKLDEDLEPGFSLLESDKDIYGSYKNIFTRLLEINNNPGTKFIFTTVYNPFKYLWIDESYDSNDYTTGYFSPVITAAPDVEFDNPLTGNEIVNVRKFLYEAEVSGMSLKQITERVNDPAGDGSYSLAQWVEGKLARLNGIIKTAVSDFGDARFMIADTKNLFDFVPDRHVYNGYNYSDLVNVEIVKGQTIADLDWGQFWDNFSVDNLNTIVTDILLKVVEEVIIPDMDPHPEWYGQYMLKRSFTNALGWQSLDRYTITFDANGGSGSMAAQEVVSVDGLPGFTTLKASTFTPPNTGYRVVGWNTAPDGSGTAFDNGQLVSLTGDLVLYAQWSNMYTVTYKHTNHTNLYPDAGNTGHTDSYALYINGEPKPKFGNFSDGSSTTYQVPYGATIRVWVDDYIDPNYKFAYNSKDCKIYFNGTQVSVGHPTEYTFTLTGNATIDFRWKIAGSLATLDAQSWEDCYITT